MLKFGVLWGNQAEQTQLHIIYFVCVTEATKYLHFLYLQLFSSLISASIYTERFMGLPIKSDNLEHYKVRILFLY